MQADFLQRKQLDTTGVRCAIRRGAAPGEWPALTPSELPRATDVRVGQGQQQRHAEKVSGGSATRHAYITANTATRPH